MKNKILYIGPILPPIGGVSVHIDRLINYMDRYSEVLLIDESKNKKKNIFNIRSLNFLKYLSIINKSDIIHIHSGIPLFIIFHLLIGKLFNKKIIITVHSFLVIEANYSFKLIKYLLKNVNKVIFVNYPPENIGLTDYIVKTAFLPPQQTYDYKFCDEISHILKIRDKYPLLIANAFRIDFYNNKDLYGLDMSVSLMNYLINMRKKKVYFIYIIADPTENSNYIKSIQNKVSSLNLDKYFLLITEPINFTELIKVSDIVLRPTVLDGDALTVREAIYFNKRVLTSDCVRRPNEVYLFETSNQKSLNHETEQLLKENKSKENKSKENKSKESYNSYYGFYKDLYTSIINEEK